MKANPDVFDSTSDALNNIQFSDIFNIDELQRLQDLFSNASGVASIITSPDGTPITSPSNFCRLCNEIIRKTEKGSKDGIKSDSMYSRSNSSGPIIQHCFNSGLWDAGASITVDGKHIASWIIGQVRDEEIDELQMLKYAEEIGANKEDFMIALNEVPVMSAEQFRKVSDMLFAFANEISEKAYNNLQLKTQITEREKTTRLLAEREERYRTLFERSSDAIFIINMSTGKYSDANGAAEIMMGKTRDELKKLDIHEITSKGTQKRLEQLLDKNDSLEIGEVEYIRPDGTTRIALLHILPLSKNHVFGIAHDITERNLAETKTLSLLAETEESRLRLLNMIDEQKRTEEQLRNSEASLHTLLQTIPDLIWLKDTEGVYLSCNIMFERLFGAKEADIVGKTDYDFVDREIADSFREHDRKAMAAGKPTSNEEWLTFADDGHRDLVETIKTPMYNASGSLIGVLGIGRDITHRKKAEEALKESERFLKETQIIANLGTYILDIDYGRWESSEILDSIFGIESDFNKSFGGWVSILHPEWQNTMNHYFIQEVIGNKIKFDKEYKIIRQNDQSERWVHGQGKLNFNEQNQPISMFGTIRDITEQKKAEQELTKSKEKAEESDRLKSAFLANMSHEIRTPMNGILGFADLLKEPDLTGEQQQEYISIIEKSGARMLNIINDIVDISKIESAQMKISLSETNVNKQIEYIYTFFKPEVEEKGIKLFVKKGLPGKDIIINTDKQKLDAILINLVKNAIKFTSKGSIEFGYKLTPSGEKAAGVAGEFIEPIELLFFVKDTGIGIPQEQKEYIFDRFRQGSVLLNRNYEGAGLGLSISKAYVEMLGGKIWVESELQKGSVFYFTLPYKPDPAKETLSKKVVLPGIEENQLNKLKILITEDDEGSEKLLSLTLKKLSKEISTAKTGVEAVQTCRNNPDIDLVLMDIHMPGMDGYEATRQIRQFNTEVVIIAQTAYALAGDREKAIRAGCNDYIPKPIRKDKLIEMIQKCFKK